MKHGGLGALLGIALAVSSEAGTLDDLAREFPRIKPLEPAAALSPFRIHPEKVKRCQEPISGTLMQESRFSVPDTFFFTGHNHAGHARGGPCAASWDLADRNGHAITTKVGTTMGWFAWPRCEYGGPGLPERADGGSGGHSPPRGGVK